MTGRASSNRVQRIADAIRPALNIYPDGVMRVSHGQEDIAETVVRLVLEADAIPNSAAIGWNQPVPIEETDEFKKVQNALGEAAADATRNRVRDELIRADVDLTTGHAFAVENGLALGVLPEWYLRRLRARNA